MRLPMRPAQPQKSRKNDGYCSAFQQSDTPHRSLHPSIACAARGPYFATPTAIPSAGVPTMAASHPNSFKARKTLKVGGKSYTYFSLAAVEKEVGDLSRLPFSLRILMENLVRHEDGTTVKKADIAAFADWVKNGGKSTKEIN